MPQPIYHLVLAQQALPVMNEWFGDLGEPEVNAFMHGSLGPDLGFFPGADPRLSELVHHARTGDMIRALYVRARSSTERVFVWGWLTHFIADALLHPVVNAWCAQQCPDASAKAERMRYHVRVELGWDVMHARHIDAVRLRSCFDANSIGFLCQAYDAVYGYPLPARVAAGFHRNATRLARQLHLLELLLARDARALTPLRGVLTATVPKNSVVHAFLNPMTPPPALAAALSHAITEFLPLFEFCLRTELREVPNLDLDDGMPIEEELEAAVA